MNGALIIGIAMILACLVIQCVALAVVLRQMQSLEQSRLSFRSWPGAVLVLSVVTIIILAGNLTQIALWASLFVYLGEFNDFMTAFYHSVVNFSTLGYGDMVMSEKNRLLGALEALNGVLMIGLSTGTMFVVVNEMLDKAWTSRHEKR
jgi:hypothetical protein